MLVTERASIQYFVDLRTKSSIHLPISTLSLPRPSRFLLSSWPVPSRCEGTPAIPLSFHPSFSRPEQEEPAASRSDRNRKSQQRPGPTGKTVSTGRALLRHPPGTLLQVTDTVPERFRRHQVPTPLFVHSVNKGPLVATPACFSTPFPRPDSRPPDTVRSAKLPRPCGVPPQPQKGTFARGIPRPTRTASNPVTSLP
jgi:hypothetical protein